jgi:glutathione synthase/RimK-type ligase-like ATP-grasp enzyme
MAIAVWGESEPLRDAIVAACEARGVAAVIVDPNEAADHDVCTPDSSVLAGADLDGVSAHLLLSFPQRLFPPRRGETADAYAQRRFRAEERALLFRSVLRGAELRGARVYNPTMACAPFEEKPYQLAAFVAHGLLIPDTLITSNAAAALVAVNHLASLGKEAIIKPVIGGNTARLVDASIRERLASSPLPGAVIVQERIAGDDIRVTIIDGEPVSVVRIASSAIDYRDDPNYVSGSPLYEEVVLPPDAVEAAVRAAAVCGHRWSGVDLRWRAGAPAVILEANSAPRYLDIERRTGAAITAHLVSRLLA